MDAEPVYNTQNTLGEGPVWHAGKRRLYWTDILANRVWYLDIDTGEAVETVFPCYAACMGIGRSGNIMVACGLGWVLWDGDGSHLEQVEPESFDPGVVRFNDGKAGPDGAFWAGTMDLNASRPVASLYRLAPSIERAFTVTEKERNLIISNGIGWSPDGSYMYLTDTGKETIYRYDFDTDTGEIENRITLIHDTERSGVPDGLAVDEDGFIWSARWGGGQVACYDPEGRCVNGISVPALQPSSCCFGGENLDRLYITSARFGIAEDTLGEYDGALFCCDPGVRGAAVPLLSV